MMRMSSVRRAVFTVLAAAIAFVPLRAQDRRLAGRLEPELATAVTRLVDSVRAVGLPADPLVGVALEGASRRAAADQILGAVREYAAALGAARATLGDSAASDEMVSAAGVIVAGVAPRVVAEYRAARPAGSLTVPFVILADLVARGVPAEDASNALLEALRAGARDDVLSEFRRRVERDILAGARPATAVSIRTRDIPGVAAPRVSPSGPSTSMPRRPASPRVRRPFG